MWEGLATTLLPRNPKTIETQICDFLILNGNLLLCSRQV